RAVLHRPERRSLQHAARHRPDRARADPGHTFQEVPSIEFFLILVSHAFLHYRRRKSAPHTSSPPECPATATSDAAQNNAIRYTTRREGWRSAGSVAMAAAAVNIAPAAPSHRCHSRRGVTSIPGADASRQPAITARNANTAPARRLMTATVRYRRSPVAIA